MKKLRKKTKMETEISTASMPDIVFLLLFFFMVSATIKPKNSPLQIRVPDAQAVTSIKKRFLIKELHVGFPKDAKLGESPRISSGDQMLTISQIGQWVQEQKSDIDEVYKDQMIVLIKADKEVDMGIIDDLQQELRKNHAQKILYKTLEEV